MGQSEDKAREELQRITHTGNRHERFPVMSGKVGSVNTGDMTCVVQLTAGADDTPTTDVLLNVTLQNVLGCYGIPADQADCIVAEVDGPGQLKQLLWASKYDKVVMSVGGTAVELTDGELKLNDGSLGALPILSKIEDNLKALKTYIKDTLEPAIQSGISAVGIGSSANGTTGATTFETAVTGADIMFEDMGNDNIKQG